MVDAASPKALRGSLRVERVSKTRGSARVLDGASLEAQPGEFVTLLGPSGCGKTTLLRLIAGLDAADEGLIFVSGRDMTGLPAHERPVHTVFQSYALFPHLTVFENVAFGLRLRRVTESEMNRRVAEALSLVRLQGLESRRPAELSGGQSQRVALARALVLEPDILLLDEPLAALDAQLRSAMRRELTQLQRALGTTFVLVTHDLEEAIECSSRIAVMRSGRIEQMAAPRAIFERPASLYVAQLVGMENLLPGRVIAREASTWRVDVGFATFAVRPPEEGGVALDTLTVGVHGEQVRLARGTGGLEGVIQETRYLGETVRCLVAIGNGSIVAHTPPHDAPGEGERVNVQVDPSAWCLLTA